MKGEKKGAKAEKKGPALFSWTKGGPEKEGAPLSWTQRGQSPALRALPSFGPFSYPKNLFSSGERKGRSPEERKKYFLSLEAEKGFALFSPFLEAPFGRAERAEQGFAILALILFNESKHPLINRINPINLLLIYDTILYLKEMYIL
jgi:hypothetical protein